MTTLAQKGGILSNLESCQVVLIASKNEFSAGNSDPESTSIPDRKPRAYVLDSIRHPAEVELLRYIYGDAFVLIGVVCEETKRTRRIQKKYDCSESDAIAFMERDADDNKKHGQHVADAFHLADFFVDNTVDRYKPNKETRQKKSWVSSGSGSLPSE